MDLLLLGQEGGTVYNGPLRLTTPYFLSIGLGDYGAGLTQGSLQSIVAAPNASVPFLDGQVAPRPVPATSVVHLYVVHQNTQNVGCCENLEFFWHVFSRTVWASAPREAKQLCTTCSDSTAHTPLQRLMIR